MLGDRNDVVTRNHERLPGARTMAASLVEHRGEFRPRLRRRVLAAKFAFAIAPSTRGNAGRHTFVAARGIDCDRGTEAAPDQGHARWIDLRALRQEGERALRVGDLLQADHAALLPTTIAATPHIEAQTDITEPIEQLARLAHALRIHVTAEAVQDNERGAPLPGCESIRDADDTSDIQVIRLESDAPLAHRLSFSPRL